MPISESAIKRVLFLVGGY